MDAEPQTPVADALVLAFTRGLSLAEWERTGLLDREWALYTHLGRVYRSLVLVTYGGRDDSAYHARLQGELPDGCALTIVSNEGGLPEAGYLAAVPGLVARVVRGGSAVVKTNQLASGPVAHEIASALRGAGVRTALVVRGGYLWSRFAAHEHGPDSAQAKDAAKAEAALCRAADAVIGTTKDMTDDLCWRYRLDPGAVHVVPNYVIDDGVPEDSVREPGLILYAGQLVPRKRVDVLIEAVSLLSSEQRSGTRLLIVGDGPELPYLTRRASELSVAAEFTPRIPHRDLLKRMSSATLYAQASSLEGHPKTVLEAMACGTPVVVADAPGLSAVVENGVTGVRVPGGSAEGFANAFAGMLDDPDWREMIGCAASRHARTTFGVRTIAEREAEVHRAALARGAARSRDAA
ncbi:MAG: glycosyltransferase [Phycisphaeraceae bacterium]|nr:MAG: glycosyltransferase [Phycisphaeraceae bacterium]